MTDQEIIKDLIYCGMKYHDKPHQLWNSLRLAAISVGDTEAAERFNEYYLTHDPIKRQLISTEQKYLNLQKLFLTNVLVNFVDKGFIKFEDYKELIEKLKE